MVEYVGLNCEKRVRIGVCSKKGHMHPMPIIVGWAVLRWMGVVNIAVAYSISSSSMFPGIRYAGRLATDPLGTLPQAEGTIQDGTGTQGSNRYGDYSAISVDPADDCTFWVTNMYGTGGQWATKIATLKFPNCTGSMGAFALSSTPTTLDICEPNDAVYDITVSAAPTFAGDVTLAAMGNPGTASFSVNPVTPTNNSILTISGATAGNYSFNVEGTATMTPSLVVSTTIDLNVYANAPSAPTLVSPANGTTNLSLPVAVSWNASANATDYLLEVATDVGFTNIVYSNTVAGTSDTVTGLNTNTTYYWRVTASNVCGAGTASTVWNFTTEPAPGDCGPGTTANIIYQEDFEAGDGGWTTGGTGNTWAWSAGNGNNSSGGWHGDDVGSITDQYLISPAFALPTGEAPLTFQFWNYQEIEDGGAGCYDGGILEVTTDGGTTWTQITAGLLTDPYDGPVDSRFNNPIAGQDAWCGDPQPWLNSIIDIDPYAGQTAQFRLRLATDASVSHPGWNMDDVKVQSCQPSAVPAIVMTKTVGTTNACGTSSDIVVDPGTTVYYCYTVQNSGDVTMTVHDLVDDQLGTLLTGYNYDLAPGASTSHIVSTTVGMNGVINTAVWTASTPGVPAVSYTDTATVTVQINPAVVLTKTVGTDVNSCGTEDPLYLLSGGGMAVYCYTVTNTGNVTLPLHTVVDDQLGTLLGPDYAHDLAPGDSYWFTVTANVTATVTNVATWTTSLVAGQPAASSTDSAMVVVRDVPTDVSLSEFGANGAIGWLVVLLALTLPALGLLWRRKRLN